MKNLQRLPKRSDKMQLAVLRIRGRVGVRKDVERTMRMLGLKTKHSLALTSNSPEILGMIKKSQDFITWGEVSKDLLETLKEKGESNVYRLAPPKGGFKTLKKHWPKGDLGYRGESINELIKRML